MEADRVSSWLHANIDFNRLTKILPEHVLGWDFNLRVFYA